MRLKSRIHFDTFESLQVRGKKTDLGTADCAIARSLQVVGDWWSLLIVREAFLGRRRFGEFQKSLGMARNVLACRLKKLVGEGILEVAKDGAGSGWSGYALTSKGERLHVVLVALWQWGEEACFEPGELGFAMVDGRSGVPLAKMVPRGLDGRPIGSRDFFLAPIVVDSATPAGAGDDRRPKADGVVG